jgi:hypothetical protein
MSGVARLARIIRQGGQGSRKSEALGVAASSGDPVAIDRPDGVHCAAYLSQKKVEDSFDSRGAFSVNGFRFERVGFAAVV